MKNPENSKALLACCGPQADSEPGAEEKTRYRDPANWTSGRIKTPAGPILQVTTSLTSRDIIGTWKARWGIGRMSYRIRPGLYGVGNPSPESPVFVTANYKMSFDRLRRELGGIDAWIMVLDTKGINVWCSAGKGTFCAEEIAKQIEKTGLSQVVSHKRLILPQLSGPGVAAHEVTKQSGFKVIFGPVQAKDIPEFLKSGMKATPEMRRAEFRFFDRIVLTPVELTGMIKPAGIIIGVLFFLKLAGVDFLSLEGVLPYLGAILVGSVLVPAFLPWIPGRAFAFKGWLAGVVLAFGVNVSYGWLLSSSPSWKQSLVTFLILPALTSFLALNFTGSSTYTSLSGVLSEMKIALPLIIISAGLGVIFMVVKLFIPL